MHEKSIDKIISLPAIYASSPGCTTPPSLWPHTHDDFSEN